MEELTDGFQNLALVRRSAVTLCDPQDGQKLGPEVFRQIMSNTKSVLCVVKGGVFIMEI